MGSRTSKYQKMNDNSDEMKITINQLLSNISDKNKKYILQEYYLFLSIYIEKTDAISIINTVKDFDYIELKKHFYGKIRKQNYYNSGFIDHYRTFIEEIDSIIDGKYD